MICRNAKPMESCLPIDLKIEKQEDGKYWNRHEIHKGPSIKI